jgi:hypothetical protein
VVLSSQSGERVLRASSARSALQVCAPTSSRVRAVLSSGRFLYISNEKEPEKLRYSAAPIHLSYVRVFGYSVLHRRHQVAAKNLQKNEKKIERSLDLILGTRTLVTGDCISNLTCGYWLVK